MKTEIVIAMAAGIFLASCAAGTAADSAPNVLCEDGICRLVDAPGAEANAPDVKAAGLEPARIAQGYMPAKKFIAFLNDEEHASDSSRL